MPKVNYLKIGKPAKVKEVKSFKTKPKVCESVKPRVCEVKCKDKQEKVNINIKNENNKNFVYRKSLNKLLADALENEMIKYFLKENKKSLNEVIKKALDSLEIK